jgi:hypothetical protein
MTSSACSVAPEGLLTNAHQAAPTAESLLRLQRPLPLGDATWPDRSVLITRQASWTGEQVDPGVGRTVIHLDPGLDVLGVRRLAQRDREVEAPWHLAERFFIGVDADESRRHDDGG